MLDLTKFRLLTQGKACLRVVCLNEFCQLMTDSKEGKPLNGMVGNKMAFERFTG